MAGVARSARLPTIQPLLSTGRNWPNPEIRGRLEHRDPWLKAELPQTTHKGHPIVRITDIRFIISAMIEPSAAMNQDSVLPHPSAVRATVAYLLSVTAATTYIIASRFPHVIVQRALGGLLYPLWQTLLVLLSDCGLIGVIWLPAAFFSALPCVLLNLLASRYRIRNPFFYVFVGCGLAVLAVTPVISATSGWTWYTDPPNPPPPPTFWQEFHSIANVFAVAGAIAGLTYWFAAGRHFRRKYNLTDSK
ncbi:hypothetical protein R69927_07348 [Paraburkholderia domus]|jgi:hypothetical protein|uniref:Uncharacterized protein n=1 Tax=Paraburkholderia domus TaxID=2793075 RepID=A0A9N8N2F1_9BURK|nr:hypothetical protein R70006_07912 [Paraburkholderia domus]CAE6878296.1 hypothetical protein R75471_01634 [Paraburkholderia domus]CAE6934436.1 hypothetical protein R69927_07348 [Paraburkholderia domus]CAE6943065.1 hypothetical protein R70211_05809 [Paraburkholderia domus]CAE6966651.1 hypothetical protein R70199_07764 [Paraburkholderia domus]